MVREEVAGEEQRGWGRAEESKGSVTRLGFLSLIRSRTHYFSCNPMICRLLLPPCIVLSYDLTVIQS